MAEAERLRALATKIAAVLARQPECIITHPAELHILRSLTNDEVRRFARERGWRSVRRLGGEQIEFYKDVAVREADAGRYHSV